MTLSSSHLPRYTEEIVPKGMGITYSDRKGHSSIKKMI